MEKILTINIIIIKRRLAMFGKNKSVGLSGIPGGILKMCGEGMIPYLARLLGIKFNIGTITGYWKMP